MTSRRIYWNLWVKRFREVIYSNCSPIWDSISTKFSVPGILMEINQSIDSVCSGSFNNAIHFIQISFIKYSILWLNTSPWNRKSYDIVSHSLYKFHILLAERPLRVKTFCRWMIWWSLNHYICPVEYSLPTI